MVGMRDVAFRSFPVMTARISSQLQCGGTLHSQTHVERNDFCLGATMGHCSSFLTGPKDGDARVGADQTNKGPSGAFAVSQIACETSVHIHDDKTIPHTIASKAKLNVVSGEMEV